MELEESNTPFEPVDDKRPRIELPLPVRLLAVSDCVLMSAAGLGPQLDRFYVGLLAFEREGTFDVIYRADNFRLRFEIVEQPPIRQDYLALGIQVDSIDNLLKKLSELEIEFLRQQKLAPGAETILLNDPAGNLLEISQIPTIL